MNINDEQNWLDRKILPLVTDPTQNSIVSQQEQQLLFLARPEHHVVLNHKPPDDFISYLRGKIGNLPQMVHVNDLPPLNHALLIPYINSEEVLTWKAVHNRLEVFGSDVEISKDEQ